MGDVVFRRVNGHVIPIKSKGGAPMRSAGGRVSAPAKQKSGRAGNYSGYPLRGGAASKTPLAFSGSHHKALFAAAGVSAFAALSSNKRTAALGLLGLNVTRAAGAVNSVQHGRQKYRETGSAFQGLGHGALRHYTNKFVSMAGAGGGGAMGAARAIYGGRRR